MQLLHWLKTNCNRFDQNRLAIIGCAQSHGSQQVSRCHLLVREKRCTVPWCSGWSVTVIFGTNVRIFSIFEGSMLCWSLICELLSEVEIRWFCCSHPHWMTYAIRFFLRLHSISQIKYYGQVSERYAISPPTIDEYLSLPNPVHWLNFFFSNYCYHVWIPEINMHFTPTHTYELFKLCKLLPSVLPVYLSENYMFRFVWVRLSFREMAFRMKRIKNEHKMLASAVAKKKLISATWASDSSSVEVNTVPVVILIFPI